MNLSRSAATFLALSLFLFSCSNVVKQDPEEPVRQFLFQFEKSLKETDLTILHQFRTQNSIKGLLQLIRVLQNKDSLIVCNLDYTKPQIQFKDSKAIATIAGTVQLRTGGDKLECSLKLKLASVNNGYVVIEFDDDFKQLSNSLLYYEKRKANREAEELRRSKSMTIARQLESKFDSVIWYTLGESDQYFYVVDRPWSNYFISYETRDDIHTNEGVKMGLVDARGDTVIPVAYSMIGTISFDKENIVEVRAGKKYGYFDLSRKAVVIDTLHDFIVPYFKDSIAAIVKTDSLYGWYDTAYHYKTGFPSEDVAVWTKENRFLERGMLFDKESRYRYVEIPESDKIGNGILMPPSYLTRYKLFPEIVSDIITTDVVMNASTYFVQKNTSLFNRIADSFNVVLTSFREEYLESREGFYHHTSVTLMDERSNVVYSGDFVGQKLNIKLRDSTLIEITSIPVYHGWGGHDAKPLYAYLVIRDTRSVQYLETGRQHPQTQFVKMDSTYLKWKFDDDGNRSIWSAATLIELENAILADYGYRFRQEDVGIVLTSITDPKKSVTIEKLLPLMTDIDRHNIMLLERFRQMDKNPPDYL